MDIAVITGEAIRVKGKNAAIVIDPTTGTNKTEADSILNLSKKADYSDKKIEGSRITIKGPGEYEVGGVKISVLKINGGQAARIDMDGVKVLIGSGKSMENVQEKIENSDILVVDANEKFNYSAIAKLDPKAVLAYGENVSEFSKSLGKQTSEKTHKYSTTFAKLPSEMQFIHLA